MENKELTKDFDLEVIKQGQGKKPKPPAEKKASEFMEESKVAEFKDKDGNQQVKISDSDDCKIDDSSLSMLKKRKSTSPPLKDGEIQAEE